MQGRAIWVWMKASICWYCCWVKACSPVFAEDSAATWFSKTDKAWCHELELSMFNKCETKLMSGCKKQERTMYRNEETKEIELLTQESKIAGKKNLVTTSNCWNTDWEKEQSALRLVIFRLNWIVKMKSEYKDYIQCFVYPTTLTNPNRMDYRFITIYLTEL